jgi:ATP-dependent Clp protease ATP-binding subunit ClpA
MARTIQAELEDKLSDELLFGRLARGGKVTADCVDGALVFRFDEANVPASA